MHTAETQSGAVACAAPRDNRAAPHAGRYAVVALEGIVAVAAFGGGASMIADPVGAMGLPPEMLDRLPVDSWLLPGVALIVCNGLLPVAVARAELRGRRWPRRFGHALTGAVLLGWPVTETLLFGYPLEGEPVWLRPAVAATGLALIGMSQLLRRRGGGPCGPGAGGSASLSASCTRPSGW